MRIFVFEIYRDRRGLVGYAASKSVEEPQHDDPRDFSVLLGYIDGELISRPVAPAQIRVGDEHLLTLSDAANWIRSRVEGTGDSRAARARAG